MHQDSAHPNMQFYDSGALTYAFTTGKPSADCPAQFALHLDLCMSQEKRHMHVPQQ